MSHTPTTASRTALVSEFTRRGLVAPLELENTFVYALVPFDAIYASVILIVEIELEERRAG